MSLLKEVSSKLDRVPEEHRPLFLRDLFSLYYLRVSVSFSVYFPIVFLFVYLSNVVLSVGGYGPLISNWLLLVVCFGVPLVFCSVYFFVYYFFYRKYGGYLE